MIEFHDVEKIQPWVVSMYWRKFCKDNLVLSETRAAYMQDEKGYKDFCFHGYNAL
jgi:hypothetical protein